MLKTRRWFTLLLAASAMAFVSASETNAPGTPNRMVLFQEFTSAVG